MTQAWNDKVAGAFSGRRVAEVTKKLHGQAAVRLNLLVFSGPQTAPMVCTVQIPGDKHVEYSVDPRPIQGK